MGKIIVHKNTYSKSLDNYRDIIVYVPDSYYESNKDYPVIYFHDGMEAFFKEWSLSNTSWGVQETIDRLVKEEIIPEVICVGISNNHDRFSEYSHVHFKSEAFNVEAEGKGEKYEAFILDEIIPSINSIYRTNGDKYMVGSSMGGVVTLITAVRNPKVFKGIVAMSSFLNIDNCKPIEYIEKCDLSNMPKIYFDYGVKEEDELYGIPNNRLRDIFIDKGLKEEKDFMFVVDEDGIHSESCWAERLPLALKYVMS